MHAVLFFGFASIVRPLATEDPNKCEIDVCCSGYRMQNDTCIECEAGTHGFNCSETCPYGYFGVQCKEMCSTGAGENCRKNTTLRQVNEHATEMESTKRPLEIVKEESRTQNFDNLSGIFMTHIVLTVSVFGLVFAAFYIALKVRKIAGIIPKDDRHTKSDIGFGVREGGRISQFYGHGYQPPVDGGSDYILPVADGHIEMYRNIV